MAGIKKTKVGSEYRVRTKSGKISGEFNKKKDAKKRKSQLQALKKNSK